MKNYKLKPGQHQFAPGEAARHSNDTLTDAEAEWYIERYPHIQSLFINPAPATIKSKRKRLNRKPEKIQINENLPTTN